MVDQKVNLLVCSLLTALKNVLRWEFRNRTEFFQSRTSRTDPVPAVELRCEVEETRRQEGHGWKNPS